MKMEKNFCIKTYRIASYENIDRDELIIWTYLAYNTAYTDEYFEKKYCEFFYEENDEAVPCSYAEYLRKMETHFTRAELIDLEKVDDSTLLHIYLSLNTNGTGFINKE